MNTKQYKYILTISEEGSILMAAKKLNVSQPYLSKFIQDIEASLGVELFDRSTTPIRITYEGELYIKTAREILSIENQTIQQIRDITHSGLGSLTIGLSAFRSTYILPFVLPLFYKKYPNINVILRECPAEDMEGLVLSGKVDFSITVPMEYSKQILIEKISTEDILLAIPKSININCKSIKICYKNKFLDLSMVRDIPFILLSEGTSLNRLAYSIFDEANYTPKTVFETCSLEAAHSMAITGIGATFIPSTMKILSESENELDYYYIDNYLPQRDIIAIFKRDKYISIAAKEFITILKDIIN